MKGVLFTAALTILALVVLTASFLFNQQAMEEQGSTARLAVFDRMADEFVSAENGFRNIVDSAYINIIMEDNVVTIGEPLPNPSSPVIDEDVEDWKDFVERTSEFTTTVNVSDISEKFPIYIDSVIYYHQSKLGGTNIRTANAESVINYSVELDISGRWTITVEEISIETGSNEFNLTVISDIAYYSNIWNLDFTKGNQFKVTIDDGSSHIVSVGVGTGDEHGRLLIDNGDQIPMYVTTVITFDTEKEVTASLSNQSINITESQYNISRVSSTRVA